MTKKDFNVIKSAIHEVCKAYEQSDSPEALSYAFYQLIRVKDTVIKDNDVIFNRPKRSSSQS